MLIKIPNTINSRTTITITKETLSELKRLSKTSALKMYETLDALVHFAAEDETFFNKAITAAKIRKTIDKENADIFSEKLSGLPKELQAKLKDMSADDLEELLKKAGI